MASRDKEFVESDPLVEISQTRPKLIERRKSLGCFLLLLLVTVTVLIIGLGVGFGIGFGTKTTPFYKSIKSSNLMTHLEKLENIAKKPSSQMSRAVAYGYNDSADWVYDELKSNGYDNVTKQYFKVATFEDLGNSSFSARISTIDFTFPFMKESQYRLMTYSGSTDGEIVSGELRVVQESGCEQEHYDSGTIALVNYTTDIALLNCTPYEMAKSAESAGVVALVMALMEGDAFTDTRVYSQTLDDFQVVQIPLLGATYELGQTLKDYLDLSNGGTVELSVATHTSVTMWYTYNVLAYTAGGKEDSIIVMGSHLDSVTAGPGINDNGSGSGANLEIALQLTSRGITPENKVLFAFWGAEELGLLGSTHFVMASVEERGIENIALNLNFDMIGSPNSIRKVYNGSGVENDAIVNECTKIQELFEEHFFSEDLKYELTPFNGRSDYGPFIDVKVDIPAGGLFTGAGETKTLEERRTYGGLAGAILDPCYHQYCDTIGNVDQEVYQQMAQAAASVLETLMMKENLRDYLNSTDSNFF